MAHDHVVAKSSYTDEHRPSELVVVLHGYGSNAQNMLGLFANLPLKNLVIHPRDKGGKQSHNNSDLTHNGQNMLSNSILKSWHYTRVDHGVSHYIIDFLNGFDASPYDGGYQWMPILSWDRAHWDYQSYESHITRAVQRLKNYIDERVKDLKEKGYTITSVTLVGFSQGAALALYAAFSDIRIGKVAALSGFLLHNTPKKSYKGRIFWYHGAEDDVVPLGFFHEAKRFFETHDVRFVSCISDGYTHNVSLEGIKGMQSFITEK